MSKKISTNSLRFESVNVLKTVSRRLFRITVNAKRAAVVSSALMIPRYQGICAVRAGTKLRNNF